MLQNQEVGVLKLKGKGRLRFTVFAIFCAANAAGFTSFAMVPEGEISPVYGEARLEKDLSGSISSQEVAKKVSEAVQQIAVTEKEERIQQIQEEEAKRKAEEERLAAEAARRAQEENQRLLAALIFCEAGNQPYEGQVAVGAVVMNRVNSGAYPGTIREVIYQSGQFGPAMTGWLDSVLASGSYTKSAMQAAADALAGSNPVGGCLSFGNGNYGIRIGDHYFH